MVLCRCGLGNDLCRRRGRCEPVQAVFECPVAADPASEIGWGGMLGGEAGDRDDDLGCSFLAVQPAGLAGDLNGLAGVSWTS